MFYTGAAPNQQAIPAVRYLMSKEGGEFAAGFLLGTDNVYPRTTNRILSAYLAAEGVNRRRTSRRSIRRSAIRIGARSSRRSRRSVEGKKDRRDIDHQRRCEQAICTTNLPPNRSTPSKIPVMALSVSERELRSVDASRLTGHMAARNYFQSVESAENDAFVKMWADFNDQRDKTTNDPMEATFIGFRMWAQAVTQAGTTDVNAVRQAMYGQRIKAPSGFEVVMNTNHHLSKPAMIGKLNPAGTFDVVWRSINPIKPPSGADIFPRAPN